MTALLVFASLVAAWWIFAALLNLTDRTVTDALAHSAAFLVTVAYTLTAALAHFRSHR